MSETGVDTYCFLDLETTAGNMNRIPQDFDLLFVGISVRGEYSFYKATADRLRVLADFVDSFDGVLVTFNGRRFDLPILNRHLLRLLGRAVSPHRHYDILAEVYRLVGHRISLGRLAYDNLGRTKQSWDHSRNAKVWRAEPGLLLAYNREDLALTADIFGLVLRQETLLVGRRRIRLPLP